MRNGKKLLNDVGFEIVSHFYIFDEKSYKVVMFLDWIHTLHFYRVVYRFLKILIPLEFRKNLWRKFLKWIYNESAPLEKGGEIVIVAKK